MEKTKLQQQMDDFMSSYLETMAFTEEVDTAKLSNEMCVQVLRECATFYLRAVRYINGREVEAAHDFWLTRNHHGAGFWDGDWEEPACSILDALSEEFGEACVYQGDDGFLYQSGGWFQ